MWRALLGTDIDVGMVNIFRLSLRRLFYRRIARILRTLLPSPTMMMAHAWILLETVRRSEAVSTTENYYCILWCAKLFNNFELFALSRPLSWPNPFGGLTRLCDYVSPTFLIFFGDL